MASNTQTVPKLLRNLRDNAKIVLQCGALTYIRSNAEKLEMTSALSKEEYGEVCSLVMDMSTSGDQNVRNEATKALHAILKYFKRHEIKFFESALRINRDKRLKIFQFLEATDDSSLAVAVHDSLTINFIEDCLSSIQSSSMEWLLPTSCTENLNILEQAENKTLSDAEELEEIIVSNALILLRRIYKTANVGVDSDCLQKFDMLLMDKVVTLAYMGHKRQRGPAIRLLKQAIEADLAMRIKINLPEVYLRYKKNIQGHYSSRMMLLVKSCESDWSSQWCVSIRILGTDLHRGAPLINKLLSVEERAFKSTDTMVRREAFISWKLLVDNLALDMRELATQRRVRLLCVPLTANNSKSELIALKKLEVWWYLITKLYSNILPFADPVVTQFLNFCFGPLGDTPLLSTKIDVIASPGKRFYKAKIIAIDSLLQLIVANQKDRKMLDGILEERLPSSISQVLFEKCYKSFLHSIGEAVIIMSKLDESEIKNREDICEVLWVNVMHYVRTTSNEAKAKVYNELILVITELQARSLEVDFVNNFLRDVIVPELSASANDLVYYDRTLVDLMTRVMIPKFLKNLRGKQCDAVKCLMWQTVRPETLTNYHPETLRFLEMTLHQLRLVPVDTDSLTDCFELWFAYAEIAYKYMRALQDVNEGTATETNFKTIESIISFPFSHMHWANSIQAQKIAVHWKDVYKKYECQADTISSIKPNEIFDNTSKMIEEYLVMNEKCYRIAVYCLDALMGTINYKFLLVQSKVPPIVRLVGDLTTIALHEGQSSEAECALKALSSLLITVYGHSPEKVLSYMNVTSQTVELMLKTDAEDTLVKEITSTWETIVSILRGLSNLLDENFLQSYKQVILLSMRHANKDISSQTLSVLELKDNVRESARAVLAEFARECKKLSGKDSTKIRAEKVDRTPKSARITGSFLNRKVSSPRTLIGRGKEDADKKLSALPPEPDSQDYVVIRSDVKLDVNLLTEHQKESFKRRRDDIPAMYNDLSKSSSQDTQDTQDLQDWFIGAKKFNNPTKSSIDEKRCSNVETKLTVDETTDKRVDTHEAKIIQVPIVVKDTAKSSDTEEKVSTMLRTPEIIASSAQDPTSESAILGESPRINQTRESSDNESKELPEQKINELDEPSLASNDSYVEETKSLDADLPCNDRASLTIAVKLNFESPDEYPVEKDKEEQRDENLSTVLVSSNKPIRGRRRARGNRIRSLTSANMLKRGTKRKATSDGENEEGSALDKRRRKTLASTSRMTENNDTANATVSQTDKRTEIEMSRLRIDMITDGPLTSRRRSKYIDDYVKSLSPKRKASRGKALRTETSSNSRRNSGVTDNESIEKKGRRRVTRTDNDGEIDGKREDEDSQIAKRKQPRGRPKRKLRESGDASESQTIIDDDEIMNDSAASSRDSEKSAECSKNNVENIDALNEEATPTDISINPSVGITETPMENDLDEVVESSQDSDVLTSSHRRSFGKIVKLKNPQDTVTSEDPPAEPVTLESKQPTATSPIIPLDVSSVTVEKNCLADEIKISGDDPDETFLDISAIRPQLADDVPIEDNEKRAPEASKTITSPVQMRAAPDGNFNFSSPKGHVKRFTKPKGFASQGRAAHMIGLVTKLASLEKDGQIDKCQVDEEIATIKRTRTREIDGESAIGKRDRTNIVREPERMGSPSGSRREKIFNNMKAADYASSPPGVKLFGNLRNNGEKISPKMEKSQAINCQDNGFNGTKDDDDGNASLKNDRDELPMLEWSSANPPSLTASPSASILKRDRSIVNNEPDPDPTTPGKVPRKRVSFADPPVSKEMGYEIETVVSPLKVGKYSTYRGSLVRKDSPVRIKQSRFVMIQIDAERQEESSNLSSSEIDMNCERDNELLIKIADNLEETVNFQETEMIEASDLSSDARSSVLNITENETIASVKLNVTLEDMVTRSSEETIGESGTSSKSSAPVEEATTQDDLFNSSDEKTDSPKRPCDSSSDVANERFNMSGQNSSIESFRLNVTDDSVIASITNATTVLAHTPESLDDTMDARNMTSLNLTGNSDGAFGELPVRTSTQEPNPVSEMDTLPVSDSIIASLLITQDSQESTQANVAIEPPEMLNSTDAIYPNLDECDKPIEDIIDSLTNPLWRKNLMKYLETRCIRTVGDLARLSEREIVRIPVKGSSKIDFVRKVLGKFERKLSDFSDRKEAMILDEPRSERLASCAQEETTILERETSKIDELPREIGKILGDVSALAIYDVSSLGSVAPNNFPSVDDLNPQVRHTLGRTSTTNSISTIIIDSSGDPETSALLEDTAPVSQISTIKVSSDIITTATTTTTTRSAATWTDSPAKTSTKSVEVQTKIEELLDDIDGNLVLQSAVKRTSAEKLLTEYKLKMGHISKMELCKETLRILGIGSDTLLKLACRECGLKKVLRDLPDIFYDDDDSNC